MNLDEFRAMKEEMEKSKSDEKETSNAQVQSTNAETNAPSQEEDGKESGQSETKPNQSKDDKTDEQSKETVDTEPTTVKIDGKEVSIDELKSGYLRQSDYTKKTQEVSRKEKQAQKALEVIEQINQNPQLAQQLTDQYNLQLPNPDKMKQEDLEARYYDLLIKDELRDLHDRFGEFDEAEVIQTAQAEGLKNLESAYHLSQSRKGGGQTQKQDTDIDSLKEELRKELMAELQKEQDANADTTTVIQTQGGNNVPQDNTPQLSASEVKVARLMGMSEKEYATWKNKK